MKDQISMRTHMIWEISHSGEAYDAGGHVYGGMVYAYPTEEL